MKRGYFPMCSRLLASRPLSWITLVLVALTAGCTLELPLLGRTLVDPPSAIGLAAYTGTLQRSCSPVDAAALALELEPAGSADLPRISILLWPPDDFRSGAAIRLDGPSGQSAAAIWAGETEWHVGAIGGLWIERYQPEQEATGMFRLDFEGEKRLEGRFQVRWFDPGPMLCG
jgi:hypothetical protein